MAETFHAWRGTLFRGVGKLLSWFRGREHVETAGQGAVLLSLIHAGSVSVDAVVDREGGSAEGLDPLSDSLIVASQPYVGRWSRLVSTTNWEKGRIIVEWREALVAQGLPISEYSDDAWGRLVGGVTGQHVGRLRRVHQRFGSTAPNYPGLFWSHFQAAIDWDDAEMWLEGARQSGWSVAQMRENRWQTLGQIETERPQAADVMAAETDEDFEPSRMQAPPITGEYDEVAGPRYEGPDFGDEPRMGQASRVQDLTEGERDAGPAVELVRPFENLPDLPDDLAEAFDGMKLAILRHKREAWSEIAAADVILTLDALKALVTAPSDEAPF